MYLTKHNKKILFLMAWLGAFFVVAQNKEEGVLLGNVFTVQKNPLKGVSIILENVLLGTETDLEGGFKITKIPFGSYIVTVSHLGFKTISQKIDIQQEQKSIVFKLEEASENLNEVIVKGLTKTERKEQQGYTVKGINVKELQKQSISLNTVLNQTSGLKVRQQGGLGARVDYNINGLTGKSVRFFLDGVPMDYFGSSYAANTIPVFLIDKIEIYKGIVPVELGNDALGGAINLISKKTTTNSTAFSYSYGSFNTHRASFNGNYVEKKTKLTTKISAFYNYSDNNYKVWGDDIYVTNTETFEIERGLKVERFHDAFESKAIKADIGFTQKKWADDFFIGILYSNLKKEIQHGATMEVPFGESKYTQNTLAPHVSYQKKNFLKKGFDVNVFSLYSKHAYKRIDTSKNIYNWYGNVEGLRTVGGEQSRTLNTLTEKAFLNRANIIYKLNKQHKIGYNYLFSAIHRIDRDPLLTQTTEGYFAPQKLNKHSMGMVFQSKFFDKKLNTSFFTKWFAYDANVKTSETSAGITTYNTVKTKASNVGYGFASSYDFFAGFKLNASLEKTYRLPETEEILGDDSVSSIYNENLTVESSLNFNLGFYVDVFQEGKNQLKISGNYFYRNVDDYINKTIIPGLGLFQYINFQKALMTGFNLEATYKLSDWFTLNQTLSTLKPKDISVNDAYGNANINYNGTLPNLPLFETNTLLKFTLKNLLQKQSSSFLYWSTSFTGEYYRYAAQIGAYNKDKIPKQLVNNVGVGHSFPEEKLSLSLDANNLFNEQVFDNFGIQNPGTALYVKLIYSLK